ncbi:MAG: tetratricopeptide repeat protein, partial [Thermodesulfobacteriota bacterium]|nr:tetratricopeptide repeat protein [Thermodesulfobacteriota bacterium]
MNKSKTIPIISILFILITWVFFSFITSLSNGFLNWDDYLHLVDRKFIHELSWENIKSMFTHYSDTYYIPLVYLSFALEYGMVGLTPFFYHYTNLTLHILNTLLVFFLIYKLDPRISVSLICALLFGLHPVHVESVVWITERKDVLSTFFFLGSLIFYSCYIKKGKISFHLLSLFLFFLAIISKPTVAILPIVLLILDYYSNRLFDKTIILEKIPYFLMSVFFGILLFYSHAFQESMGCAFSLYERIIIACRALTFYLYKIIIPLNLSAFYPYPKTLGIDYYLAPFLILGMLSGIFILRHNKKIIFGALFFLITIGPTLKIIPSGEAIAADRYMYIPSIGLFYIAGLIFSFFYYMEKTKLLMAFSFFGVITFFSILTWERCQIWENDKTLWLDVINKYPYFYGAYQNLGIYYANTGNLDKAKIEFKKAIDLNPYNKEGYFNL